MSFGRQTAGRVMEEFAGHIRHGHWTRRRLNDLAAGQMLLGERSNDAAAVETSFAFASSTNPA